MHPMSPVVAVVAAAAVGVLPTVGPVTAVAAPASTVAASDAPADDTLTTVDLLTPAADDAPPLARQRAADALRGGTGAATEVLERAVPTEGAVVVGLAWEPAGQSRPRAEVRFGRDGVWEEWADVEMQPTADDDAPGHAVASEMSDGLVAAGADTVQVRLTGLDTAPVSAARLVLVDGGPDPAFGGPGTAAPALAALDAPAVGTPAPAASTAPTVHRRATWGADESIAYEDCRTPDYADRLERFVVHHTAGTNSYSAADVPAILRGIQSFHRQGRGWCDVGYNFLVDKFGRVFEGRRGGIDQLVVGVHASGFNTGTVGVSVLGEYTKVAPTAATISAISHLIGWKSYLHGLDPTGASPKNGTVYRHVIGHKEVAATACPGLIQGYLTTIAAQARAIMLDFPPLFRDVSTIAGVLGSRPARVTAVLPVAADWRIDVVDAADTTIGSASGTAPAGGVATLTLPVRPAGVSSSGATLTARITAVATNGTPFGTTTPLHLAPAPQVPFERIVASPDFDGDGLGDVFAVDRTGRLYLYIGTGNGSIRLERAYGLGWTGLDVHAPGDWSGDGQTDLLAVDGDGDLWLYQGVESTGGFARALQVGHGWTGFRVTPSGDMSGDGVPDLLAIDPAQRLWLYPGNGSGRFRPRVQAGYGWGGFELHAAGDMNGDRRADALGIDASGRLWFYGGRGDGQFYRKVRVGQGWTGYTFLSGSDLDGDGTNDLLGRDPAGRLWFYAGHPGPAFAKAKQVGHGW